MSEATEREAGSLPQLPAKWLHVLTPRSQVRSGRADFKPQILDDVGNALSRERCIPPYAHTERIDAYRFSEFLICLQMGREKEAVAPHSTYRLQRNTKRRVGRLIRAYSLVPSTC